MGLHLSLCILHPHFLRSALRMHHLQNEKTGAVFVVTQVKLEETVHFHKFPFPIPMFFDHGYWLCRQDIRYVSK